MSLLYVRGASGNVAVPDLGITIAQGPSWTLLASSSPESEGGSDGQFTAREIRDSKDLYDAINGGTVEWSKDGASAEAAVDYVADFMLMQDFTDDYLDLSSGRLRLPQATDIPNTLVSGLQEGEIAWDTDDDTLYVYNGSTWVSAASVIDHGNLDGLDDDDHEQYALLDGDLLRNIFTGGADFSTASGLILPTGTDPTGLAEVEGNMFWDTDDDIPYWYDGTSWVTLSGIHTHAHGDLTGIGPNDHHTRYTDAEAIAAVGPHFSGDHNDLTNLDSDDHPQYTEWNNTETVSGLWTFAGPADSPSFVLDPETSAPASNLTDGGISYVNGIPYVYDGTRSKWLSIERLTYTAGRNHQNSTDIYMRVADGIATSTTGVRMLRDGTITGLFAQTEGNESWTFEVRRNGSVIASLVIAAASGGQDAAANVDFSAGDVIQFYVNGNKIAYPVGGIEVAWRV